MISSDTPRPQNQSCPAGGTNSHHSGERGVIVAPPCGNTDPYTVLHCGFDTLTLAIKATLPREMLTMLEDGKARAEAEGKSVEVDINGVPLMLQHYGGAGYQFIASGGRFGASWSFKKPKPKDPWGVRLSFGSDFLVHRGIGGAIAHIEHAMHRFGMRFDDQDVSLSRVDFCADFLAPDFDLNPDQFVMHSSCLRHDFKTDLEKSVHGRSSRTSSVTIGAIRNRQVIVYDKRSEVLKRKKAHWWTIWNTALAVQGLAQLDPTNRNLSQVWRIEIRAGKDQLKDRWNIRTFPDFFARIGDLCRHTVDMVRYTEPLPNDANRSRWPNHPIWESFRHVVEHDLSEMRSQADPDRTKEVNKEQHMSTILLNIIGCSVTLGALNEQTFEDLPAFFAETASEMGKKVQERPEKYAKLLEDAKARYRFV